MASVEVRPFLVLGPESRAFQIEKEETTVGRTPESDIVLDHEQVSRRHATVRRQAGKTLLTDEGSSNGTFVNGRRIAGTVELQDGDRVRFAVVDGIFHTSAAGPSQAPPPPVARPAGGPLAETAARSQPTPPGLPIHAAHQAPGPPPQTGPTKPRGAPSAALERFGDAPVLLEEGELTFGRVAGNDVVLGDSMVSSRHAKVVNQEGEFYLIDLGSSNGTFVNGQRISQPWLLEQGDEIVMGGTEFIFRRLSKLARRKKGAPRAPGQGPRPGGPPPRT